MFNDNVFILFFYLFSLGAFYQRHTLKILFFLFVSVVNRSLFQLFFPNHFKGFRGN